MSLWSVPVSMLAGLALALIPASLSAADGPMVDTETLELCVDTQHALDGLLAELDLSQARLAERRSDIDEGEARLLEIKAVVEDEDADVDPEVRSAMVAEFNTINANRAAQIPAYQDERDYVGSLIDQYNEMTDAYNEQCGDISYIAEELAAICDGRPELANTRWCGRVQ
jgi:hypothetical protein